MNGAAVMRWVRACAGAVFTVAALAATLAVRDAMPTYEERYRPLGDSGAVGEKLGTLDFTFTADKVVLAKAVRTRPDTGFSDTVASKRLFKTDLVWVIVQGRTTATRRALTDPIDGARAITADGVEMRTGSGAFLPPAERGDQVPMGRAMGVTFVFDVPPEDLDGLRMRLTDPPGLIDEEFTGLPWQDARLAPGVEVDLGLDAESARDARDAYELPEYE
ncbi:hypothetical protein CLV63_101225 [Murinocardiopsis flavida]|uniref:DUF4352 domain-containing protein n=1 Tax=Murinocardiopsis flavida TaxID=645275 RepID=A0A2P8DU54_9ACTN|nr:hypothetical protein [Murinocardiopsis flavida]PSL00749.1 hypothetical protein CLV63_101225 [Murinocardiopsis flavida]